MIGLGLAGKAGHDVAAQPEPGPNPTDAVHKKGHGSGILRAPAHGRQHGRGRALQGDMQMRADQPGLGQDREPRLGEDGRVQGAEPQAHRAAVARGQFPVEKRHEPPERVGRGQIPAEMAKIDAGEPQFPVSGGDEALGLGQDVRHRP